MRLRLRIASFLGPFPLSIVNPGGYCQLHLSGQGYTVTIVNRVITLGHIYWREEMRQINGGLEDSFTSQHYVTSPPCSSSQAEGPTLDESGRPTQPFPRESWLNQEAHLTQRQTTHLLTYDAWPTVGALKMTRASSISPSGALHSEQSLKLRG